MLVKILKKAVQSKEALNPTMRPSNEHAIARWMRVGLERRLPYQTKLRTALHWPSGPSFEGAGVALKASSSCS